MIDLIQFLIDNMYYTILGLCLILLVISYFIGKKKLKEQNELIEEELKENRINTPKTKKRFVQGQIIKEQELSINNKENKS